MAEIRYPRLGTFVHGRENNFNLIRVTAALAVLVSHSFALATGSAADEPLHASIGMTPGDIAVDIFFVTSGFLLAASVQKRSLADFVRARVLRIYPALLLVVVASVFVLGPAMTTVSLAQYFMSPETYKYLLKCSTLFFGVTYELPGVFATNPMHAVNGSLWTLPHEVRCYAILAALWLVSLRTRLSFSQMVYCAVVLFAALMFYGGKFPPLALMFFAGTALYQLRDRLVMSGIAAAAMLAILLGSALVSHLAFRIVFLVVAPYLVLYGAYVPSGFVRLYNRLGDYSYGIYILAFPIQQLVISRSGGTTPESVLLYSAPITILLAVVSWHVIESRALALRDTRPAASRRIPVSADIERS